MDVAIIKYNAGNIYSVSYALKRLGVEATITADPELLCKADKVIFPGVGEAHTTCLLYTSPSPRDMRRSRMPSSA